MPTPRSPRTDPSSRDADIARNRDSVASRIRDRGVDPDGARSPEELIDLLSAIEGFENAVSRRGGDNMINTLQSSEPEHEALVLPARKAGESVGAYTRRIRRATDHLGGDAPPPGPVGMEAEDDER